MAENSQGNESRPSAESRGKEWELLEKVAMASVQEQRKARRWGIFFKFLTFGYLFIVLSLMLHGGADKAGSIRGDHTAVVNITGEIADGKDANADTINQGLEAAFKAKSSKAVILNINSPGGSPVQSAYVYEEIRSLRKQYPAKKVYAVIGDLGASGAYYIASAADDIYVSPASLVGSIGVIMQGFGVQGLVQKLGVEDRTMTAGAHKAIMSPFKEVTPEEKAHIQGLLDSIHQQFIAAVKQGRGNRLKETPDTFSGLFWTGQQAVGMGLADGYGSVQTVARDIVHAKDVEDYTVSGSGFDKALKKLGVTMGDEVAAKLGVGDSVSVR
jgi:protease-4